MDALITAYEAKGQELQMIQVLIAGTLSIR
jgi:hypothetical protein